MLGKLDDTLWHQLPTTFDHVGTSDPRFFDRYWFAIYEPNGAAALQATLGVYNNMNVVDSGVVLVRGDEQYNLRASRALRPRFEAEVGPLRVDPVEPLERLTLQLQPDVALSPPLSFDLEWRAILAPEEEKPHFRRERGRAVEDYQRFNQVGEVSGWLQLGDERIDVDRWWSARDHSWGVRQAMGIPEPVTGAQPAPGERGTLFAFLFFSTQALAGHLQLMERGEQRLYLTGLVRERGTQREWSVQELELDFSLFDGTRRFSEAHFDATLEGGRVLRFSTRPLGRAIAMPGLGYGGWNDGAGLGVYRGEAHVEGEVWNVSHPADVVLANGRVDRPYHRISPVHVESDFKSGDAGTGSLTFIAMGRLPQYGLEGE